MAKNFWLIIFLMAMIISAPTLALAKTSVTKAKEPITKIKILIVPGHEPNDGGAEYRQLKERDLNVIIAESLYKKLKNDGRYDVTLARDNISWETELDEFFIKN